MAQVKDGSTFALSDDDYKKIIAKVPLRPGADIYQLRKDIALAADLFVELTNNFDSERQIRNELLKLEKSLNEAQKGLAGLGLAARQRLWETAASPPTDGSAWRCPIANEMHGLDRMSNLARAAAEATRVKGAPRRRPALGLSVLLQAWKVATGTSAFTAEIDEGFQAFMREFRSALQRLGVAIPPSSKRQMLQAQKYI